MRVGVAFLMATVAMAGAAQMGAAQVSFLPMNGRRIVAPDGKPGAWFGESLAVDGDTMVIGAPDNWDTPYTSSGAAYVFVRQGKSWVLQQKLVSDAAVGGHFGMGVAIEGNTIAVGAPLNTVDTYVSGAVHIFVRINSQWIHQAKVRPSDSALGDLFGWHLALSSGRLLVGAHGMGARAAYVFEHIGKVWAQTAKLVPPAPWSQPNFGWSVSLSGDTALVGPTWYQTDAGGYVGGECVFIHTAMGWKLEQVLQQPKAVSDDHFASSAAISGDTAIVGAYGRDTRAGDDAGIAYIYVRSNGKWHLTQTVAPTDGATGDAFGCLVAIEGDTAAVSSIVADTDNGVDAGAVYVLKREGTQWKITSRLEAAAGTTGDELGSSVGVSNGVVAMGAYLADTAAGIDTGAAYVTGFGNALQ